jgi:hypothetical protein
VTEASCKAGKRNHGPSTHSLSLSLTHTHAHAQLDQIARKAAVGLRSLGRSVGGLKRSDGASARVPSGACGRSEPSGGRRSSQPSSTVDTIQEPAASRTTPRRSGEYDREIALQSISS